MQVFEPFWSETGIDFVMVSNRVGFLGPGTFWRKLTNILLLSIVTGID